MDATAIAKEAFITQNYELAADMYERIMAQDGPSVHSMLGLADSLARSGNIRRAFESYTTAYRLGNIQPDKLEHLVTALVDIIVAKEDKEDTKDETPNRSSRQPCGMFSCDLCKSFWMDPVTMLCGHTFCRKCIERSKSKQCKTCGKFDPRRLKHAKTNVLLQTCIKGWFPREIESRELKEEGNRCAQEKQYIKAADFYTMALAIDTCLVCECADAENDTVSNMEQEGDCQAPSDHLILSNRSHVYTLMGRYNEALQDALQAIDLQPDWSKGYFRKGQILRELSRHEEASKAYLQCLMLDPKTPAAREELTKVLHSMVSPLAQSDVTKPSERLCLNVQRTMPFSEILLSPTSLEQLRDSLKPSYEGASQIGAQPNSIWCTTGSHTGHAADTSTSNVFKIPNTSTKRKLSAGSQDQADTSSMLGDVSSWQPARPPVMPSANPDSDNAATYNILGDSSSWQPARPSPRPKRRSCDSRTSKVIDVPSEVLDTEDWCCPLCMRLLYEPLTTPCGHVFCRSCLNRTLDHKSMCPLCKTSLVEFLAERTGSVTEAVHQILLNYFPDDYEERKQIHDEEMDEISMMGVDGHDVPVFVCTIAYPQVQCPLHVFEPRYRLMIRQCMEAGTRQFGMSVTFGTEEEFAQYGTMLEIRNLQYFPDGRAVLDTVGGKRFRVLDRSTRDGYNTAKVEFIEDFPIVDEDKEELLKRHNRIHTQAKHWFTSLPESQRSRIVQHLGTFPDLESAPLDGPNGPKWTWWLLASLPLDQRAQVLVLGMQKLSDRLKALTRVLNYHTSQTTQTQ